MAEMMTSAPLALSGVAALVAIGAFGAGRILARTEPVRSRIQPHRVDMVLLGIAYWTTAIFGLQWASVEGAASPVWPAAGVGFAGLLIGGMRLWPAIFVARIAATTITGSAQPWWAEVMISAGNTAATLAAVFLLVRWLPIDRRLTSSRDFLCLVAAAAVIGGLGALVSLVALGLSNSFVADDEVQAFVNAWLGTSVGTLLVAPLMMAWSYRSTWRLRRRWWFGLGASMAALAAISYGIFLNDALPFLRTWYVYPVLIWIAANYQVRGASAALIVVMIAATWSATVQAGAFEVVAGAALGPVSLSQQFMLVTVLSVLLVAAASDERRGMEALHRSEARESSIVNTAVDPIVVIDEQANIVSFNPAAERTFGYRVDEVIGRNVRMLMPEPVRSMEDDYMERYRRTGERRILGTGRQIMGLRKDGSVFPLDLSVAEWESGESRFFTGIIHDQTERVRVEEALRASEHRLATAIEASGGGVYEQTVPAGEDLHVSPQWLGILGLQALPVPPEKFETWVSGLVHPADRDKRRAAWDAFVEGLEPRFEVEVRKRHADGSWIWVRSYAQATERDDTGRVRRLSGITIDITARKAAQMQVEHMAHHDALTGLANRTLFSERLGEAAALADVRGMAAGLILIDLDNFKTINDTMGHHVGDEVLKIVTERILSSIRAGDTAARLGGDEFAVVVSDMSDVAMIADLAERLHEAVGHPATVEGRQTRITASVGFAAYPDHAETVEQLQRHADLALYDAKGAGRDRARPFHPHLAEAANHQRCVESALREAIENDELLLHFQPQRDMESGRIDCIEALVRWPREGRIVPPSEFISIAEASGLIEPLGAWVMKAALRQQVAWRAEGYWVCVSVNVSPAQVAAPEFVSNLRKVMQESGLPGDAIEIEITESLLLDPDAPAVQEFLAACRELGIGLALDDFGTGYSSLRYLGELPIDKVKIDRSFVSRIPHDDDNTLVEAIVNLGHRLGKRLIAEGVETEVQQAFLDSVGCDGIQGYLLSRPVAAAEITGLLKGQAGSSDAGRELRVISA